MSAFQSEKRHTDEIDLLSPLKQVNRWTPELFRQSEYWNLKSGRWELNEKGHLIFSCDRSCNVSENIAIVGSHSWKNYRIDIQFKFITASLRPPEGGMIVYYYLRNLNNFYSFHFCLYKKQVEFIKRYQGEWYSGPKKNIDFELNKAFKVSITSQDGRHRCHGKDFVVDVDEKIKIKNGRMGIGVKYCDVEFQSISVAFS